MRSVRRYVVQEYRQHDIIKQHVQQPVFVTTKETLLVQYQSWLTWHLYRDADENQLFHYDSLDFLLQLRLQEYR